MAIYHLSVKPVSRGVGRSSTAASAYRAAARVADERTGETFDYTRKRGVEHAEIVLPSAAASEAEWARDRQRLWNAAERAENRKDARVAREYEVALPYELNATQRLGLVRAFAQELADRHGCAVDVAVHAPHREGDTRNHHAHLLTTTRAVATTGLGTKTDIELKDTDRARKGLGPARSEVTAIRERWATLVNEHLAQHGHAARIDHRSLDAQGLEREPTQHKGPAVTAIERRGERTRVGDRIREDVAERLKLAAALGRLERESRDLARSIIDTTADLKAALADRAEIAAPRSAEDLRRDARESWLQARTSIVGNATTEARQPALDLGGDLAAARREAREQWLAQRMNPEHSSAKETGAAEPENSPPKIILPGSEHEIK
jgi:hypothetical protein